MIKQGHFTFKKVFRDYPWTTWLISISIFITVISIIGNFALWIFEEKIEEEIIFHYDLLEIEHKIVSYNEILYMSLTLYFLTNDSKWLDLYQENNELLINEIDKAAEKVVYSKGIVEKVYEANQRLASIKEKAFQYYNVGNQVEAIEILSSKTFSDSKAEFETAIFKAIKHTDNIILNNLKTNKSREIAILTIVFIAGFFYLLSWLLFLLLVTRYSKDFAFRVDESLRTVSHDMRDPLSSMIGYSQLLVDEIDGPLNEKQKASLMRIKSVGKRLLAIILDILNFSKLESKTAKLQLEEFELIELIHHSVMSYEFIAKEKGNKLEEDFCSSSIYIYSDPVKLSQVIDNLISNALKNTEGGKVIIKVDVINSNIKVAIKNPGEGIPSERLQSIFDPYLQINGEKTKISEGFGLGLAIAKKYMEFIGGTINVESEEGKETIFILTLPVKIQKKGEYL